MMAYPDVRSWPGSGKAPHARAGSRSCRRLRARPRQRASIRLSQWKQQDFAAKAAATPGELGQWLTPLVDAGADIFHCSQRRFWEADFEGSALNFAGWAKKLTGKPSSSVGSVGLSGEFTAAYAGEASTPASLDELTARMEREEFDLIAVGRALLQDPDWAQKIRNGRNDELMTFTKEALGKLY